MGSWSAAEAERYLARLEPIGWRFGLERIQALTTVLGMPQHRFASLHVVGTNGKSSVTAMTAALLEAHGVRAGAYLSPHRERWSERVQVGGRELEPDAFGAAVARVSEAAAVVDRALPEGESVTQFEAMTAAAFVALAAARVEVAVIEAGLGGRLDATNVLPSRATALTSVGLEHTQWLGESETEIAAEKLAVLRDHSVLVLGEVGPEIVELARRVAADRHSRLVVAGEVPAGSELPAPYLRRDLGVAVELAATVGGPLDPRRTRSAAAALALPGRMEVHGSAPPLVLDAAHNPQGSAALAEALADRFAGRPVYACMAVLSDKDAAGMLAAIAPALEAIVCTQIPPGQLRGAGRPGTSSIGSQELATLARAAGVGRVEAEPDPGAGVAWAVALAEEGEGVALACGSHYLLPYAAEAGPARPPSARRHR